MKAPRFFGPPTLQQGGVYGATLGLMVGLAVLLAMHFDNDKRALVNPGWFGVVSAEELAAQGRTVVRVFEGGHSEALFLISADLTRADRAILTLRSAYTAPPRIGALPPSISAALLENLDAVITASEWRDDNLRCLHPDYWNIEVVQRGEVRRYRRTSCADEHEPARALALAMDRAVAGALPDCAPPRTPGHFDEHYRCIATSGDRMAAGAVWGALVAEDEDAPRGSYLMARLSSDMVYAPWGASKMSGRSSALALLKGHPLPDTYNVGSATGLTADKVVLQGNFMGLPDGGESNYVFLFTQTWEKRRGQWELAAWATTGCRRYSSWYDDVPTPCPAYLKPMRTMAGIPAA